MISRIDGLGPVRSTTPVRRTSKANKASGTSFSEHLEGADETSGVHSSSALGSVSGVLDLQEVDDALARAARGKLRAEDLLDKLDDIRLDLLSGTLTKTKLLKLAEVVNSRRTEVSDPKLSAILDEIDLRAQVELAKFTRA